MKMFCNQCEETMNGQGCTKAGMCGKTGEVADLQDKLIYLTKMIAKKGKSTDEENDFIIKSLFSTITNANFDPDYFQKRIEEGKQFVEISDRELEENSGTAAEMDEDKRALIELLTYGLKGLCAYLDHAHVLGYQDKEIEKFLREALVSTLGDKSAEDLTELVLRCGEFGIRTMALLDKANTESYGNPEPTKVDLKAGDNPGILVSGHDLRDLKELLEQTDGSGVDIYTHGEMLPANSYPELKRYSHLKGNYGGSWWKQKEEFEKFNGPVLMTTNCLVPPDNSYKDRVYCTGVVGYSGLLHIADREQGKQKDFSSIIEHAKKCKPPEKLEEGSIIGGYSHNTILSVADKIIDAVKEGKIRRFLVMGGCDGRHKEREYYTEFAKALPKDTVILTAGCAKYRYNKLDLGEIDGIPRVLDAGQCNDSYSLILVAQKLAQATGADDINELPISYNIAWYEQKAVLVLLALLSAGVKNIHLGPKLPAFISPGVLDVLVSKFNMSGISSPEDDIKKLVT
jgi:hydroxylamine reductase